MFICTYIGIHRFKKIWGNDKYQIQDNVTSEEKEGKGIGVKSVWT